MGKFKLGIKAKDKVTGFTGTITAHCSYLTGYDQYLLTPPVDKEGKIVEGQWNDVNRLEEVEGERMVLNTDKDKGAMDQAPKY